MGTRHLVPALLFTQLILAKAEVKELARLAEDADDTKDIMACVGAVSCKRVEIDFETLLSEARLMFPEGYIMAKEQPDEDENEPNGKFLTFNFKEDSGLASATVTLQRTDNDWLLQAKLKYPRQANMINFIQSCGQDCEVLVKKAEVAESMAVDSQGDEKRLQMLERFAIERPLPGMMELFSNRKKNKKVNITIAAYYSSDYDALMAGHAELGIQNEIDALNQIMTRNELRIKFKTKCVSFLDLDESRNSSARFDEFEGMLGTWSNVLKTADMAAAFYHASTSERVCGMARLDPYSYKRIPILFIGHECSPHTLAHEIGHIFGCRHNYEVDPKGTSNHGYLIKGTPYRTVMAYRTAVHHTRIDLFSNAARKYEGVRIGDPKSKNVKQIAATKATYAAFGDESWGSCDAGPCVDTDFYNCSQLENLGYCEPSFEEYGYVRFMCPKSCGVCTVTCPGDVDSALCSLIAQLGLCDQLGQLFCATSCGLC